MSYLGSKFKHWTKKTHFYKDALHHVWMKLFKYFYRIAFNVFGFGKEGKIDTINNNNNNKYWSGVHKTQDILWISKGTGNLSDTIYSQTK